MGEALTRVKEKADLAKRANEAFHEALKGIAQGIGIAAFLQVEQVFERIAGAIPEAIHKGEEFLETVHKIQESTGASAEEISRFVGSLQTLGINTDGLSTRMGVFSRLILAHKDAMNAMGIATEDASGKTLNQIEIMNNARSVFSQGESGVVKMADALRILGRSGAQFIDYLNLTDQQAAALNQEMDRLHVTVGQQAVADAHKAAIEGQLLNEGWQGLANTIETAVAPGIIKATEMVRQFIEQNADRIAELTSKVVGFVLGMMEALLGSTTVFDGVDAGLTDMISTIHEGDQSLADLSATTAGAASATGSLTYKTVSNAGAIKAQSYALREQQGQLEETIKKIQALEAAEENSWQHQMARLDKQLGGMLALLDAEDQRKRNAQELASAEQAITDAQAARDKAGQITPLEQAQGAREYADAQKAVLDATAALATAEKGRDPAKIADAQDKLNSAEERYHELQLSTTQSAQARADAIASADADLANAKARLAAVQADQSEAAKRDEIQKTRDYLQAILYTEQNTVNKKSAIALFEKDLKVQLSKLARDQANGDEQAVADDKIKIEALKTATGRENAALRNADQLDEAEKAKQAISDQISALSQEETQTKKVAVAVADVGNKFGDAATSANGAGAQVQAAMRGATATVVTLADAIGGDDMASGTGGALPTHSVSSAFAMAEAAAKSFGQSIADALKPVHDVLDSTVGTLGTLISDLGGISFGSIALAVAGNAALTGNTPLMLFALAAAGIWAAGNQDPNNPTIPTKSRPDIPGAGTKTSNAGGSTSAAALAQARENATAMLAKLANADPKGSYSITETNAQALARLTHEMATGVFTNSGYGTGGVAGLHGKELAWLGERGPELVTPFSQMPQQAMQLPPIINKIYLDGQEIRGFISQVLADELRRYGGPVQPGSVF